MIHLLTLLLGVYGNQGSKGTPKEHYKEEPQWNWTAGKTHFYTFFLVSFELQWFLDFRTPFLRDLQKSRNQWNLKTCGSTHLYFRFFWFLSRSFVLLILVDRFASAVFPFSYTKSFQQKLWWWWSANKTTTHLNGIQLILIFCEYSSNSQFFTWTTVSPSVLVVFQGFHSRWRPAQGDEGQQNQQRMLHFYASSSFLENIYLSCWHCCAETTIASSEAEGRASEGRGGRVG